MITLFVHIPSWSIEDPPLDLKRVTHHSIKALSQPVFSSSTEPFVPHSRVRHSAGFARVVYDFPINFSIGDLVDATQNFKYIPRSRQ